MRLLPHTTSESARNQHDFRTAPGTAQHPHRWRKKARVSAFRKPLQEKAIFFNFFNFYFFITAEIGTLTVRRQEGLRKVPQESQKAVCDCKNNYCATPLEPVPVWPPFNGRLLENK